MVETIQQTVREWAVHNFPSGAKWRPCSCNGSISGSRCAIRFDSPTSAGTASASRRTSAEKRSAEFSPKRAIEAARERRDRTYDPALVDVFVAHGMEWFARLAQSDTCDAVLELEPQPL